MKEKLIKFAWYFLIWFLFMIFTAIVAKPLADNNFPVPTSSLLINTIICFLIPYIIYRKFMDYKAKHEIKIKDIVSGVGIYFFAIVVLTLVLHSNDKSQIAENKIATEKIENVAEEEKLSDEQKAREEQEKLAAVQNSEPSLADKIKETIKSSVEEQIEQLKKEAQEFAQDEIYVGSLKLIDGGGNNQDWYVLTKSVKRFKEGIIFETYQGFQADVIIKKGGTDEIISPIPITIKFYNNNNILESEENVKYYIEGGMGGGSKDYLIPRKNEMLLVASSDFLQGLISIVRKVYSVSKKFSLLN